MNEDRENLSIKDVIDLEIFLNFDKIVKMGHVGGYTVFGSEGRFLLLLVCNYL